MLKGCFIFPLDAEINNDNITNQLKLNLEDKGLKSKILKINELPFSREEINDYIKLNKVSELLDSIIDYILKQNKDNSYIIFQGFDTSNDDSIFYTEINRKISKVLGFPVIATSIIPNNISSIVLTPQVNIIACINQASSDIADKLINYNSDKISARMAQFMLVEKAKSQLKRIVLPEGDCDRIIKSAAEIKRLGFAVPILVGNNDKVQSLAKEINVNIDGIEIIDIEKFPEFDDYVNTYFELRQHKGMTIEKARELMQDVSFFGTMLVHKNYVDGMVSGAVHTTAETIIPALQFIKTKPGISSISGAFLMCFKDKMTVFGDCAVLPNPTPSQLAEIAESSSFLAKSFEIDPIIAMISYATGDSGQGPDVEAVIEAVNIAKEKYPNLKLDGPLQFDAAIDENVAKTKMPNSNVAGKANVFVFPDLNTGNSVYKAVQRSAEDAIAIGPILQGLKKPINDLSRGSTVMDIINTVAITALQAQTN